MEKQGQEVKALGMTVLTQRFRVTRVLEMQQSQTHLSRLFLCNKAHGRIMEIIKKKKLKSRMQVNDVATQYSKDKARQGGDGLGDQRVHRETL